MALAAMVGAVVGAVVGLVIFLVSTEPIHVLVDGANPRKVAWLVAREHCADDGLESVEVTVTVKRSGAEQTYSFDCDDLPNLAAWLHQARSSD